MRAFETLGASGQVRRLKHLAQQALEHYRLGIARLIPLTNHYNTLFRVELPNGNRYILRIHRPSLHAPEAVRSELIWLEALRRDTQLRVPTAIPSNTGDLVTVVAADGIADPRICVLFEWMAGSLRDRRLTVNHLRQVGEFTAHLHDHVTHWALPLEFSRGRVDNVTTFARLQLDPLSDTVIEHMAVLLAQVHSHQAANCAAAALRKIRATQRSLGYGAEVFGLIHGDLHQENYLFSGGTVGAIDFDDCGYGHFVYDLAVTLREIHHRPDYPSLRASFLAGYRQVRPLDIVHEEHLGAFFALRDLQLMFSVLEERTHPAFRDIWKAAVTDTIETLESFVES